MPPDACEVLIECRDFPAALAFYQNHLGLRLDRIFPADQPRVAHLSDSGLELQLQGPAAPVPGLDGLPDPEQWIEGRAGMLYRDLLPDRLGGRVIVSHIHIPKGGPVPDYVHHHGVLFQMIYVLAGWVRVVYEGQGEPFVMNAGDCVLQPPHIRHRVLECSDGLEVIEIGSPAEHETHVEHKLDLPNGTDNPDRSWQNQRFVFHRSRQASIAKHPAFGGFDVRDLGIARATGGQVRALVLTCRVNDESRSLPATPRDVLLLNLAEGSCRHLKPGQSNPLSMRDTNTTWLYIELPASETESHV